MTLQTGSSVTSSPLYFVAIVVLVLGPVIPFVTGTRLIFVGMTAFLTVGYWKEMLQMLIRSLCWLTGVGTAWALLTL